MMRSGQLTTESNPLWYLDFKGYRGSSETICLCELIRRSKLPFFTMENSSWRRLTTTQTAELKDLITYLRPLIRDNICFYLLSMIVMLDTSNLSESDTCESVSQLQSVSFISNITHASITDNFQQPTTMADSEFSEAASDMVVNYSQHVNANKNDVAFNV